MPRVKPACLQVTLPHAASSLLEAPLSNLSISFHQPLLGSFLTFAPLLPFFTQPQARLSFLERMPWMSCKTSITPSKPQTLQTPNPTSTPCVGPPLAASSTTCRAALSAVRPSGGAACACSWPRPWSAQSWSRSSNRAWQILPENGGSLLLLLQRSQGAALSGHQIGIVTK